jgi:glycosyltransferase involved in cell wall biosynthesis
MPKISIIIPIYNEEKTLREILDKVTTLNFKGWDKEIVAINDASTDRTPEILSDYAGKIKVLNHAINQGKGTAVRNGLSIASGDFLVIQDADLEYDPSEIANLLKLASDNNTIVYGSRNLYHEKRRGFFVQRWGTWFTTKLINILYGAHLTDVWTCYKVFPAKSKNLYAPGKFVSDIIFLVRTLRLGYTLIETPISHKPRNVEEGKKIRYRDGLIAIVEILKDRLAHLRKENEIKVKDTLNLVVDPIHRDALRREKEFLISASGEKYRIDSAGRPYFMEESRANSFRDDHESGINWLKSFFKQFPLLYYSIWHVFCPVLMVVNSPRKIKKYLKSGSSVLDVGSGPERLGNEFINVDIFPFPEVDVVADATRLPFKDESFEGVVSEAVLEHVSNPETAAQEMMLVLKKGGYLYVSIPFIQPYHASPDDFNRWTRSGLKHLFKDLEVVELGVRSGPISALLVFFAYWLGVLLSFGSKKIAPFITFFLMLIIGPFKFLDLLVYWIPGSDVVSTQLYIIARKKTQIPGL